MRDFRRLEVWQEGHNIALGAYQITAQFPKQELYGLVSQIRRCTVSIPNNIAEGCERATEKELKRFCDISMGSASELEYLYLLSFDLKYISRDEYDKSSEPLIRLKKRLNAFIHKLKAK